MRAHPGDAEARSSTVKGIVLFLSTVVAFALLDTIAKHMTRDYHVVQIAWGRYVFHVAFLAVLMPRHGVLKPLRSARPWFQVMRAALLASMTILFFTGISFLPLAEAAAIGFVAPLFVTALAHFLLDEKVGIRRWTAVCVGFLGVLIVIRPGLGVMHWAAFIILFMAGCNAFYHIATRVLAGVDPPQTTIFYTGIIGALLLSAVVPFFWLPLDVAAWLKLIGMGFFGGFGHYLLIRAYEFAEPSVVAPYTYTQIVWMIALGYLVFGDLPDAWTLIGAAVISASGIYVFYREAMLRRVGGT
ncbi:MAG TPA: DMT family transporter [Alphaproteobacteria bacterium]|nr:DMT family transporter [Alphaproteobacteria bacterium]